MVSNCFLTFRGYLICFWFGFFIFINDVFDMKLVGLVELEVLIINIRVLSLNIYMVCMVSFIIFFRIGLLVFR